MERKTLEWKVERAALWETHGEASCKAAPRTLSSDGCEKEDNMSRDKVKCVSLGHWRRMRELQDEKVRLSWI